MAAADSETSPTDFPRPAVAVDLVILTIVEDQLRVLLIERGMPPFQGQWALPGGFVRVGRDPLDQGESVEDAAHRELAEETGLQRGSAWLEQLYTFGTPNRDPRMRVISVAWYALMRPDLAPSVRAGTDATGVQWWPLDALPPLAFDHAHIVQVALERIRGKLSYAPIAFALVPPAFTINELRTVYEVITSEPHDRGNFRRRVQRMIEDGLISPLPDKRPTATKPARLFRFNRTPSATP